MRIWVLRLLAVAASIGAGLLLLGVLMEVGNAVGSATLSGGALVHTGLIFFLWPVFAIGIYMLLSRLLGLKARER
jgi:hypothetical protein